MKKALKNTKMTTLTNKSIGGIAILVLSIVLASCDDFLEIQPKGSLSENVLSNEQGVRALLIGAYGALDGVAGDPWRDSPDNWIYGSVAGGDAHKGSHPNDQRQIFTIGTGQATPTTSFLNDKWRTLYEGVSRANAVLKILGDVTDMDESAKTSAAAEARFLRGHYYFELKKMFNMVPWIDENTTDYKTPNDRDIWPDIEADFQFAMDNLPAVQSEVGRVNKWAAASYLAKAYLYQQKWSEAKSLFDDIIANGVTSEGIPYDLNDHFRDNFEPAAEKGNPEAVFVIQQVGDEGIGDIPNSNAGQRLNYPYNSPFLCCGFYQPTQDLVNSYRTDATGLPLPDAYNDAMVSNDMNIASTEHFDPYAGNLDPRLDWTVGRRGVPFLDWGPHPGERWVRDQVSSGPYSAKKNVYWQARQGEDAVLTWSPGTAINVNVIRFADVLLMAAEAEVELNNLDAARQLVNRVRSRVTDSDGWTTNDLNQAYAAAVVDNQAAMLNSGASPGQWVVRTDLGSTFVLLNGDPTNLSNWQEYTDPASNYVVDVYPAGHVAFQTQDAAREAVHFERKIELALEGHRFFDLVRWGEANEKLNAFFDYESTLIPTIGVGSFTTGKNEYYPIPQNQIDLSTVNGEPTLQQNPGYN